MATEIDRSELGTEAQEPATSWTRLDSELRMLCRSLANPAGWTPDAVTTFVRMPGDAEYRQAIGTLCRRLAAEHGLEQSVRRQGDDWTVRFARPTVAGTAVAAKSVAKPVLVRGGLRAAIVRAYAAARQLTGLWTGQRVDVV